MVTISSAINMALILKLAQTEVIIHLTQIYTIVQSFWCVDIDKTKQAELSV